MNRAAGSGPFYPEPSRVQRAAGLAGVFGALLWLVSLGALANPVAECGPDGCSLDRGSLALIGLSPMLLGVAALGLELRARHAPGLADLVGDLTVGTSAVLFGLVAVTGIGGLIVSALLLMLVGTLIFGATGYRNGARQRMASAVAAIGAGSFLAFLFLGASSNGAGYETPSVMGLLLFAIGWGWMSGHLLLGRPLPIPGAQERVT